MAAPKLPGKRRKDRMKPYGASPNGEGNEKGI